VLTGWKLPTLVVWLAYPYCIRYADFSCPWPRTKGPCGVHSFSRIFIPRNFRSQDFSGTRTVAILEEKVIESSHLVKVLSAAHIIGVAVSSHWGSYQVTWPWMRSHKVLPARPHNVYLFGPHSRVWIIMVALWNRADHYIFILWFLLSSSFFFFLA